MWSRAKGLAILLTAVWLVGCAGVSMRGGEMPRWVKEGSRAFEDGEVKAFYGVGAVVGVDNEPLARTAAENRARAEVAKVFATYTASLMKDYMAATRGGATVSDSPATEEQHIEQSIKTFSAVTLSGVKIVDHWIDPERRTYYALARLDLEHFKDQLDRIRELNAQVRDFIRSNADRSFEALAREEALSGRGGP